MQVLCLAITENWWLTHHRLSLNSIPLVSLINPHFSVSAINLSYLGFVPLRLFLSFFPLLFCFSFSFRPEILYLKSHSTLSLPLFVSNDLEIRQSWLLVLHNKYNNFHFLNIQYQMQCSFFFPSLFPLSLSLSLPPPPLFLFFSASPLTTSILSQCVVSVN